MNRFPHLAQRLFNVPLAVRPEKAEVVVAALAERLGVTRMVRVDGRELALHDAAYAGLFGEEPARERPYDVVNGVALIPVEGLLVHKLGSLRPYSGMTGYDGIRANLFCALDDPEVKAIVFDIDSPGGEVAGCMDLSDVIFAARGPKPMWSILSETAYSAAYAIASATDRIIVPRTGGTGSIGCICMHVDFSRALDAAGITVTMIQFGARKADGAAEIPLSPEALTRFQADIDACGELFVETVARNRKLDAAKVRAQEAGIFRGEKGVAEGLADAVLAPDVAFAALIAELTK